MAGRLLQPLGLSELEEHIYTALVTDQALTSDDVGRRVGITAPQATNALETLEGLGLVTRSLGPPVRFLPAAPEVGLEALIRRREQELEGIRPALATLSQRFHKGVARAGDIFLLVEVITGRKAIARSFLDLQRGARREVIGFDAPPYAVQVKTPTDAELDALARGIRYRYIYDPRALEVTGMAGLIERYVTAGEEARILGDLPVKLALVDDATALIPIDTTHGSVDGAIVLKESPLLRAMKLLFEQCWDRAMPLHFGEPLIRERNVAREADTVAAPSSPTDRRILGLLAAGLKDQTVASQLGLGLSTVERRVRQLMQILGARSRFQAGAEAHRRGWLD